jgi:hypothetical protein
MRALTVNEWSFVAGGDDEPMQEVVITGKRCNDDWSCISVEELERFLENSYTPLTPPSGGGGGPPISTAETEKALEKAMAETDDKLREQALVGAALAIMGAVVLAFPPSVVALGVAGLIAKFGIGVSAALLSLGGTWMFTDAMDELDNGP